jgi:TRAP-type C4-dicarboxylate transport system substrate-binding protein
MKKWRTLGLAVIVFAVVALILSGCAAKTETPTTPTTPGTPTTPETPGVELPTLEWNFHSVLGDDKLAVEATGIPGSVAGYRILFDKIDKYTDGKWQNYIFLKSALGYGGTTIYEPVGKGLVQWGEMYSCHVGGRWAGQDVCETPFAFPFPLEVDLYWKLREALDPYWQDQLDEENLFMITNHFGSGGRNFSFSVDPSVYPMPKEWKIRVCGDRTAKFIEAWGGTPIFIDYLEVYDALSRGMCHGTDAGTSIVTMGWKDAAPDWYLLDARELMVGATQCMYIVSNDTWSNVPKDWQDYALMLWEEEAEQKLVRDPLAHTMYYYDLCVEQGWAEVVQPIPELFTEVKAAVLEIWEPWFKQTHGEPAATMYDVMMGVLSDYYG